MSKMLVVVLAAALQLSSTFRPARITSGSYGEVPYGARAAGVVVLEAGEDAEAFIAAVRERYEKAPVGALLGASGVSSLSRSVRYLLESGAELVVGGSESSAPGCRFDNTVLRATGEAFLANPAGLQTEAFGNCTLFVVATGGDQMGEIAGVVEGSLTGCIYSAESGFDDPTYEQVAMRLRPRVGRLLNDKMPTGVAVVPSMNHGGPYPATGHPGFTAVGIPASLRRFSMLECYDNVRENRLPEELRDAHSIEGLWRLIDGEWTQGNVSASPAGG